MSIYKAHNVNRAVSKVLAVARCAEIVLKATGCTE